MNEQLQVIVDAIKDYGAAIISTISVGGIAAVAGVIAKVKAGIDKTKEQMNAVLAKKEEAQEQMNSQYSLLATQINDQNKKLDEITTQLTKIKK